MCIFQVFLRPLGLVSCRAGSVKCVKSVTAVPRIMVVCLSVLRDVHESSRTCHGTSLPCLTVHDGRFGVEA